VESKILNFPDAMRLAQIVSKYLDIDSIKKMTGEEFAYNIFSQMEVEEIISVANLLGIENIETLEPNDLILLGVKKMIDNRLLDLLITYKQIGFGK
jgi:hypothetical protein